MTNKRYSFIIQNALTITLPVRYSFIIQNAWTITLPVKRVLAIFWQDELYCIHSMILFLPLFESMFQHHKLPCNICVVISPKANTFTSLHLFFTLTPNSGELSISENGQC